LIGHARAVTFIAGAIAIAAAAINIKDFFWFKRGVSLSIPEQAKPGLFTRMRALVRADRLANMIASTVALAVLANFYELLCTAGFPMLYTRILTLRELPAAEYYFYLVLYNVVYVIPLAAIVAAFAYTLGARKLSEREGRILKLLSGTMMLELGMVLILAPTWLDSPWIALILIAAALVVTWIVARSSSPALDPKNTTRS
jgi:hypothetical protein